MSKPLDKFIKEEEVPWPLLIRGDMFEVKGDEVPALETSLIDFILGKLTFGYSNPYNNDFIPAVQFDGERSSVYCDLEYDDFQRIKDVILNTSNIFLLAKCNDLLFVHTSEKPYCVEAVRNHLLIAEHFLKNDEVFAALEFIERSLFLLKAVSDHKEIASAIDKLVFKSTYSKPNDLERVINAVFDFFSKLVLIRNITKRS